MPKPDIYDIAFLVFYAIAAGSFITAAFISGIVLGLVMTGLVALVTCFGMLVFATGKDK